MNRSLPTAQEILVPGLLAGAAFSAAAAWRGRTDSGSAIAALNAPSHVLWGESAIVEQRATLRHTLPGVAINVGAGVFWAAVMQTLFRGATHRGGRGAQLAAGGAASALAWLIDYHLIPHRLSPGIETRVSGGSLLGIHGIFALGLGVGAALTATGQRAHRGRETVPVRGVQEVLTLSRVFDAPRERVWNAWTDPGQISRWWGPAGFSAPAIAIDLREGGRYLYCMRSPDGEDYWSTGVFREIEPLARIVATDSFADAEGNVVPATYYGMRPAFPLELVVTVTFEEHNGRTRLTLKHAGFPSREDRESAREGWSGSLDKLGAVVSGT